MNKKILSLLVASLLSGCSVTTDYDEKERDKQTSMNQTQDVFYSAFVGEIMETSGQNNNAIKHYENILKKQYNEDYFNKLFSLYLYKKDTVSIVNLIKNTEEKNIYSNHNNLIVLLEIENKNNKKAIENFNNKINESEDLNVISYIKNLKAQLQMFALFYNNDSEKYKSFLTELKKTNLSLYNLSIGLINEDSNGVLYLGHNDFLSGHEKTIVNISKYYNEEKEDDFKTLINDEFLSNKDKVFIAESRHLLLLKNKEFKNVQKLTRYLDSVNLVATDKQNMVDFLSYYFTFNNNDALYKLSKNKDSFSPDYYYYYKAVLNYRLGYKNAAKKYFLNVEDQKMLKSDIYLYIDLMGVEDISNFDNLEDIEKNILKFGFYIKKNDEIKAKAELDKIKVYSENEGDSTFKTYTVSDLDYIFNQKYNLVQMLEESKVKYEKDNSVENANSYIYAMILSDSDLGSIDAVYVKHEQDFEDNDFYVDTKAMFLFYKGDTEAALSLYKKHKMFYIKNIEVQRNIYNMYKKINNKNKMQLHKNIIKSLDIK